MPSMAVLYPNFRELCLITVETYYINDILPLPRNFYGFNIYLL